MAMSCQNCASYRGLSKSLTPKCGRLPNKDNALPIMSVHWCDKWSKKEIGIDLARRGADKSVTQDCSLDRVRLLAFANKRTMLASHEELFVQIERGELGVLFDLAIEALGNRLS